MNQQRDNDPYHNVTREYLRETKLDSRKERGQYFTPESLRDRLLDQIPQIESPSVLDPAAGTGEFLWSARQYFDHPRLEGWEIDEALVRRCRQLVPDADVHRRNSLHAPFEEQFDVVVGNPPYFEFQPESEVRERYEDVMYGRVNIYGLFFKLGLEVLKPGGWLGYVTSSSMNNGAYFSNLREYIVNHANVEHLTVLEDPGVFEDVRQSVMLIVLQKTDHTGEHVLRHHDRLIFSERAEQLRDTFSNHTTLADLGWTVKTGRVVWNQNRDRLTGDPNNGIPLIWSSNITEDGLNIPHDKDRPQYIQWGDSRTGPAIVVNRVTGAASRASIRAALIPEDVEFVAENHTNVILPPGDEPAVNPEAVLRELRTPSNIDTIRKITGNSQVSRTELRHFFPMNL